MLLGHAGVDAVKQQLLGRAARADMLVEHPGQLIQPARIDSPQRLARALVAAVDQTGLAVALERGDPPADRPDANAELGRLGRVAIHLRGARPVGLARLAG